MISVHDFGGQVLTGQGGKATPPIGHIVVGFYTGIETDVPEGSYPGARLLSLDRQSIVVLPNHKILMESVAKVEPGTVLALEYQGKSGSGKYDRWEISCLPEESLKELGKSDALRAVMVRSEKWFKSVGIPVAANGNGKS